MNKQAFIFYCFISVLLFNCSKKIIVNPSTPIDNKVIIGDKTKIYSRILGEDREIWISVPTSESYF